MRRTVVVSALILMLPALASAQRGGGTRSEAPKRSDFGFDSSDSFGRRPAAVSARDLQELDPLAILLDKHKDLKLTDEQTVKLRDMEAKLDSAHRMPFRALDSLNRQMPRGGSGMSDDDAATARTVGTLTRLIIGGVRERYDSVEKDARALLTDDQRKKADDVLGDSHDKLSRIARAGRGPRGG